MLSSTRCKHCRHKLSDGERVLHEACVAPWYEANKEKLRAKARKVDWAEKRAERVEIKQKLEKLKSVSKLEAECRLIVQELARIRDRHDGCISCHMGANYGGMWHGSHFMAAGNHSAVELNLLNVHKACAQCNLFKNGNLADYRPRLIEKIGLAKVEWLEAQNQTVKRTREYLYRFKAVMGKRLRRMRKRAKD